MYWGLAVVFVVLWLLAALFAWAGNRLQHKLTGEPRTWSEGWFDRTTEVINKSKSSWPGWIAGLLVQIWYAGYAAGLVTEARRLGRGTDLWLHATAILGLVLAAAVFYFLFSRVLDGRLKRGVYALNPAISTAAYIVFMGRADLASLLFETWQHVFRAFGEGFLESL